MKINLLILLILFSVLLGGCGNTDNASSEASKKENNTNTVNNSEDSKDNKDSKDSKDSEEVKEQIVNDVAGFWFNEEQGPIEIKFKGVHKGTLSYISVGNSISYSLEILEANEGTLTVKKTSGTEGDTILQLSKNTNGGIEIFNKDENHSYTFAEADKNFIVNNFNYSLEETNTSTSNTNESLEIEEYDEEVVPDIVVYEYGSSNEFGKRILESVFKQTNQTYYYRPIMNRAEGYYIYKPIEERGIKVDVLLDFKINKDNLDNIPNDILLTTPYKYSGHGDEIYSYNSFAFPLEQNELYLMVEEKIQLLKSQKFISDIDFIRVGDKTEVQIPDGMTLEEFMKK
ncbi:hypothetical protein [Pseudalkalibacillus caeni]|uniref:Lipoprotein n=1 Tax=Exobacillus caeni TaxID=2574798 RepID=A0A5R9F6G5_9BACL|nr:hypothetical protein [Pseudalkalibacillus caeni]TLS38611.1 hypothetical protein FCL54_03680 [Pseudalkalibacillus caeni]